MRTDTDYGKEFDNEVDNYNKWLSSHSSMERAKEGARKVRGSFSQDFVSGLYYMLAWNVEIPLLKMRHPIYGKEELTPEQKDAIALASDVKMAVAKTREDLEARCFPKEQAEVGERYAESLLGPLYAHYRDVYVAHAMRRI